MRGDRKKDKEIRRWEDQKIRKE